MFTSLQPQERLTALSATSSDLLSNSTAYALPGTDSGLTTSTRSLDSLTHASSTSYGDLIPIVTPIVPIFDPIIINPIFFTDDTLATANNLGTLSSTVTRNGFVGNSDTVDFYRLDLTGSNLNITLTGLSNDADVQLIRDLNNNGQIDAGEVLARATRGSNDDESINLHNLSSGSYFVQVSQYFGDTNYTLRLSNTFTSNLLATEANVGVLSGTRTYTNPSYSEGESYDRRNGMRSTDSSDIYQFSLNSVRNVSIALTGLSSDADVRLIQDSNNNGIVDAGEVLASSTHSSNWNEAINKNLDIGNYFVQVYRYNGDTNYNLSLSESAARVQFTVNQVQALNNPDSGWFGDDADFYTRITINGNTWQSGDISNDNNITPNWTYTNTVNSRYVSISAQLWDSDWPDGDDRIDLDPSSGLRDLNLTYDIVTGNITGDVSGISGQLLSITGAGDGDRARMWFTVNTGDWYSLNLKDTTVEDLTRSFAADGQLSRTDMMAILRDTQDGGVINNTELTDLRTVLSDRGYLMPEYVRVLTHKVINSDPANTRSGIGNLFGGSNANRMEQLVNKWFEGGDRPTAISYDRTQTYGYQSMGGSLFQNGISYRDVNQNDLGDCYFLASLGAVALDSPTTIQNMFVSHNDDNGDGIVDSWTVRMFNNGVADYVTVDRFLPTDAAGNAVFAGWGGGHFSETNNELWVALLEKAYAQFNESGWIGQDNTNSYNGTTTTATPVSSNSGGINGGWADTALRHITGRSVSDHDMTSWFGLFNSVDDMITAFNNDRMVVLCTPSDTSDLIVSSHCYTLVGYNAATDRFQIYNPWASDGGTPVDGANDGLRWITRQQLLNDFDEWAAIN